jgi:hypothetical protein
MMQYLIDNPATAAAFLSFLAAMFAAIATWRGPISAAHLAEKLRQQTEAEGERRRLKLFVFSTIMQERAFIASTESVKALNLIDVVFRESTEVREAWAELFLSFDLKHNVPEHAKEERLRKLLRAMAVDIGIADGLRLDDFGRVYYPNAIAQEERLRQLEREAALRRLQGQLPPTANTATPQAAWPPKPDSEG